VKDSHIDLEESPSAKVLMSCLE